MKPSVRWILSLTIVGTALMGYKALEMSRAMLSPVKQAHEQPIPPKLAPDFSLPNYQGGGNVRLSDLKGKVVLVNFYETSCPHCQHEMGDFNRVYRELKPRGFEIVGISLDQDGLLDGAQQVSTIAHRFKVTYPLLIGNEMVADRYGGINSVPMSFLVDRQGRLIRSFSGAVEAERLKQAIVPLL